MANQSPKRKPFSESLTEEEESQVRQRAYALWKARKDDGKTSAADDWNEAIEQLKAEQKFPGKKLRKAGGWIWQRSGLKGKTLWDILQLLVVPLTLAVVGFGLQEYTKQRDRQIADDKTKQDQHIADDKAKQETLVKYLGEMSDLLNDGLLKSSPNSEKVIIAQAKTVTALQSLDAKRQHLVIQFLEAANLNDLNQYGLLHKARMSKADLTGSDLSGAVLIGADLAEARFGCIAETCSDLSGANLNSADLFRADLRGASFNVADLRFADLSDAFLSGADLVGANLSDAFLSGADLRDVFLYAADLSRADLSGADFSSAYLDEADLSGADLKDTLFFNTDLRNIEGLPTLEGKTPPLVCNVALPPGVSIDPDRDCDRVPQELFTRHSEEFPTLEAAQKFVDAGGQYNFNRRASMVIRIPQR